jgi:hypothetical protein
MLRSTLTLLAITLAPPAWAGECGSLVASVCDPPSQSQPTRHKVITVKPTVTPYRVGDRFPVETRSLLLDPARYDLAPSDGSWRYYALNGAVYRVETGTGVVLEVIRNRHTAHLR